MIDDTWYRDTYIPTVGKRGAAIIEARGLSSAASAANAAIDHVRDWVSGTAGRWVTMGVASDGSYGIPQDVIYGVPCVCANGKYEVVKGLGDRRLFTSENGRDVKRAARRARWRCAPVGIDTLAMNDASCSPRLPKPKKSVALSGVVAGNTALCTVGRSGNDLHYRGYDILDIAARCEFEEIAYLLVHGKLPTVIRARRLQAQAEEPACNPGRGAARA